MSNAVRARDIQTFFGVFDVAALRLGDLLSEATEHYFETPRTILTDKVRAKYLPEYTASITQIRDAIANKSFAAAFFELQSLVAHISSNYGPFISSEHPMKGNKLNELVDSCLEDVKLAGKIIFDERPDENIAAQIKASIPADRPAPIRVRIEENRLVLHQTQTRAGQIDLASADKLRAAILSNLKEALDALDANTNVDRRFIRSLRSLSRTLLRPIADCSIEAIGINTEILSGQLAAIKEELNTLDVVQIEQIIKSSLILVAQFEEWNNYQNEAQKIDLKSIDGNSIISHVEELAAELEAHEQVVDKEIVFRLRDMTGPVRSGYTGSDTVLPALMPSLSNLFGNISSYMLEITANYTSQISSSQKVAGAVVIAVLCQKIVENFFPVFAQYKPLRFIIPVIEFTAKYFSPIAKMLGL